MVEAAHPPIILTGQVFIITRNRENLKLGRVQIYAFKSADILNWIHQKKESYAPVLKAMQEEMDYKSDLVSRIEYDSRAKDDLWNRVLTLRPLVKNYSNLVWAKISSDLMPLANGSTDADGKFEISIQSDTPIVLFAHSSREVGDETEYYTWLISRWDGTRVDMSNDNMTGPFPAFSISSL